MHGRSAPNGQIWNDVDEQKKIRAEVGKDEVDVKRNRLTAARAQKLANAHQNSDAIREIESRVLSESVHVMPGPYFLQAALQ